MTKLFKKAKYKALKLIVRKKQAFVKEKIAESIGKPKELQDMPNKTLISNFIALEDDETLTPTMTTTQSLQFSKTTFEKLKKLSRIFSY